jgi:hypothetical protein
MNAHRTLPLCLVLAALLAMAAGCSTPYPWQKSSLDSERIQQLRAESPGPIQYKACVGLWVDPQNWEARPLDQLRALSKGASELPGQIVMTAARLGEEAGKAEGGVAALLGELQAAADKHRSLAAAIARESRSPKSGGETKEMEKKLTTALGELEKLKAEAPKVAKLTLKEVSETMNRLNEVLTSVEEIGGRLAKLAESRKELNPAAIAFSKAADPLQQTAIALQMKDAAKFKKNVEEALKELEAACDSLRRTLPKGKNFAGDVATLKTAVERVLGSYQSAAGKAYKGQSALKAAMGALEKAARAGVPSTGSVDAAGKKISAFLASVKAEADAKGAAGPDPEVIAQVRNLAVRVDGLLRSTEYAAGSESFTNELAVQVLEEAATAFREACVVMQNAAELAAASRLSDAAAELSGTKASIETLAPRLEEAADEVASDAEPSLSLGAEPEVFRKGISEVLGKFEMFHTVDELADVPPEAGCEALLAEARRLGYDFLVLVQPRRNDVNYLGFNANHWYNLLIWSFAWFASNFVPDEKWESHITMDLCIIDVRSGQELFRREIDSKESLNLADTADGYHFLGIVFGPCDEEDLTDAAEYVLPHHVELIKAKILEDLTVSFRQFTLSEEFESKRDAAPPEGFGLAVGVSDYQDASFNVERLAGQEAASELAAAVGGFAATMEQVAASLKAQETDPKTRTLFDGGDAMRKARRLAGLAHAELSRRDAPTALRSLGETLTALGDAVEKLKGVYGLGKRVEARLLGAKGLIREFEGLRDRAKSFKTQEGFKSLVLRQEGILKNIKEVPDDVKKIVVEISGKEKEEAEVQTALEAVGKAQTVLGEAVNRFRESDMDGGKKAQRRALAALLTARKKLDPLKALSVNLNAVLGKIDWLVAEQKKAIEESGKVKADPALPKLTGDLDKAMKKIADVVTDVEAQEKKAGGEGKQNLLMASVLGKGQVTAREGADLITNASDLLGQGARLEAAAALEQAGTLLVNLSAELAPLVAGKRTLVGAVLKTAGDLEALAIRMQKALDQSAFDAPAAEGQGIARMVRELMGVLEKYDASLSEVQGDLSRGDARARKAGKELAVLLRTLQNAIGTLKSAAAQFQSNAIPGGHDALKRVVTALVSFRMKLENFARTVPAVGAVVFGMEHTIEQHRAVLRLATRASGRAAKAYGDLGGKQAEFAKELLGTETELREIEKSFSASRGRVPDVFQALRASARLVRETAGTVSSAARSFKKGSGLVGFRDTGNALESLARTRNTLTGAVEGKKTGIEFVQEIVNGLSGSGLRLASVAKRLRLEAQKLGLEFAAADADAMSGLLEGPKGFSPAYVQTLLNKDATLANLRAALDEAKRNQVMPKDLFVLYFAGTGAMRKAAFHKREEILAMAAEIEKLKVKLDALSKQAASAPPSPGLVKAANAQADLAKALEAFAQDLAARQRSLQALRTAGLGEQISSDIGEIETLAGMAAKAAGAPGAKDFAATAEQIAARWETVARHFGENLPPAPEQKGIAGKLDGACKSIGALLKEIEGLRAHLKKELGGGAEKKAAERLVKVSESLAAAAAKLPGTAKAAATKAAAGVEAAGSAVHEAGAALENADLRRAVDALDRAVGDGKTSGLSGVMEGIKEITALAAQKKELTEILGILKADLAKGRGLVVDPQGKDSGMAWNKKLDVLPRAALDVQGTVLSMERILGRLGKSKNLELKGIVEEARTAIEDSARLLMQPREMLQRAKNWGEAADSIGQGLAKIEGAAKALAGALTKAGKLADAVKGAGGLTAQVRKAREQAAKGGAGAKTAAAELKAFDGKAKALAKVLGTAASDLLASEKASAEVLLVLVKVAGAMGDRIGQASEARDALLQGRGAAAAEVLGAMQKELGAASEMLAKEKAKAEGIEALANTAGELAGRAGKTLADVQAAKASPRLLAVLEGMEGALETARKCNETASMLAAAVKENVPEPARSTAAAKGCMGVTQGTLEAALTAGRANDLAGTREKLGLAAVAAGKAVDALRTLQKTMQDLYTRYLLLHDTDLANPGETAISLFELANMVENLGARKVVIILDTSFATETGPRSRGVLGNGIPPKSLDQAHLKDLCRTGTWAVCKGSQPDQFAAENPGKKAGKLTFLFVDGLRGAADVDRNGKVTWKELAGYVGRELQKETGLAIQTPLFMGPEGDVVFDFKARGAKKGGGKSR